MSKRIVLVGLAALCAVAFSAIAASSAFAKPTENNTAYTCVKVATGTGDFKNAHCNPKAANESETKDWGHVVIKAGEETQLTLKNIGSTKLEATIGSAEVVLTATGAECSGCMVHNQEPEAGVMDATGTGGKIVFTGVTINVGGCTVTGEKVETEPLSVTTQSTSVGEIVPVAGPTATQAVIHLNAGCSIGEKITVTGIARGAVEGATVVFNTGAEELKIGKQIAHLKGTATISAGLTQTAKEKEEGKEPVHNPVSLTKA